MSINFGSSESAGSESERDESVVGETSRHLDSSGGPASEEGGLNSTGDGALDRSWSSSLIHLNSSAQTSPPKVRLFSSNISQFGPLFNNLKVTSS